MFDLSGKSALVTGASGGIGTAIARTLCANGAKVGLSGTRVEPWCIENIILSISAFKIHVWLSLGPDTTYIIARNAYYRTVPESEGERKVCVSGWR